MICNKIHVANDTLEFNKNENLYIFFMNAIVRCLQEHSELWASLTWDLRLQLLFRYCGQASLRSHSNFHGLVTPSYLKYEERLKTTRFYMRNSQYQNLVTAVQKGVCFVSNAVRNAHYLSAIRRECRQEKRKRSSRLEKCNLLIPAVLNSYTGLFEHFQPTPGTHLLCLLLDKSGREEKRRNYCGNQKHNSYLC